MSKPTPWEKAMEMAEDLCPIDNCDEDPGEVFAIVLRLREPWVIGFALGFLGAPDGLVPDRIVRGRTYYQGYEAGVTKAAE